MGFGNVTSLQNKRDSSRLEMLQAEGRDKWESGAQLRLQMLPRRKRDFPEAADDLSWEMPQEAGEKPGEKHPVQEVGRSIRKSHLSRSLQSQQLSVILGRVRVSKSLQYSSLGYFRSR